MSHENLKNQLKQSSLLPRTVSIFQGTEILLQISWNMLTLMTSFLFLIFPMPSLFGILSWLQKQSISWLDCWLATVSLFSNSMLRCSTSSLPTSILPKIISSSTQIYSHCDATIRNLIRNKVASLHKDDIKSDILEQSTQKKMKEEKSSGLLGGQYPINSFELEYTLLYFRWQEIAGCSK